MLRVNPVYQKELRTNARSFKTYLIIFAFNGLLSLFGLLTLYLTFEYKQGLGGSVQYSDVLEIYTIITAVEFFLLMLVVPAVTAGSVSGERERQTLEILLTTKLTAGSIIRGKLLSSISMMLFLTFTSLPVMALVFTIGGITLRDMAEFLLLIIITAVYLGSIGIFFSVLFKKSTSATVGTFGSVLVLSFGTIGITMGIRFIMQMHLNNTLDKATSYVQADIGNWMLLLLVNPVVNYLSVLKGQTGIATQVSYLFDHVGSVSPAIRNIWFPLSSAIQLIIAILLLVISTAILNPCRGKR